MPKAKGRLLRRLLIAVVIIGAALVAIPLIPLSPLKNAAEVRLTEMLGRKVTVDSVRLNVIGGPYLSFTGMSAEEDPAFGDGIFIRADEARADLDIIHYLRTRNLLIRTLSLKSPLINLTKNENGIWSWTTLSKPMEGRTAVPTALSRVSCAAFLATPLAGKLSAASLRTLKIENASVRLIDRTGSQPPETLYKKISLTVSLSPATDVDGASVAKGDLIAASEEDGESDLLKANLPLDLQIAGSDVSSLSVNGSIGPGPFESKNLKVGEFALTGKFHAERGSPLAGEGRMSASNMFIPTINLSERVAGALKVESIGDMNPGTTVSNLETDFQFSHSTVNTNGLVVQQLDGLGDATAQNGNFKIESALIVNYAAMVNLSADATSRVKSASPIWGAIVTIFESNNRVSVPININGDVRKPLIQVDVSRIF